jgi:hypothetical protein
MWSAGNVREGEGAGYQGETDEKPLRFDEGRAAGLLLWNVSMDSDSCPLQFLLILPEANYSYLHLHFLG